MKQSLLAVFLLLVTTFTAEAQTSYSVCEGLVNSRLIDTSARSELNMVSREEFNDFCSLQESMAASWSDRSSGFQASFSSFGESLGFGSASQSSAGEQDQYFEMVCQSGSSQFSLHVESREETSSGAFVAQQVNECIRILTSTGQQILTGTVEGNADPNRFTVTFNYQPGDAGSFGASLVGIEGDEVQCSRNEGGQNVPVPDFELVDTAAITCRISDGQSAAKGQFVFRTGDRSWTVPYEFVSGDLAATLRSEYEAIRDVNSQLNDQIRALRAEIESLSARDSVLIRGYIGDGSFEYHVNAACNTSYPAMRTEMSAECASRGLTLADEDFTSFPRPAGLSGCAQFVAAVCR